MGIDLSKLDEPEQPVDSGKPLQIPLANIIADKDQPRKDFSGEAMDEFIANIAESGIKTPISVRPNPDVPDHWVINFGERRYRAALANDFETIPCFVDEQSSDYDQVTENIQRDELKPIEIATFIDRKVKEGDKKADIAKRLGKSKPYINTHLALINMPEVIKEAFDSGRCTSPTTIYVLTNLYKKHADKLNEWIPQQENINRGTLDKFRREVLEVTGQTNEPENTNGSDITETPLLDPKEQTDDNEQNDITENSDLDGEGKSPKIKEKGVIKKPLLTVLIDKREATLDLKLKPTHQGMIHIVFEDGTREEVSIEVCSLVSLVDANE